ncbi:pyridoxal phosphate-dependent decarboxylase family protein [Streptomyces iconiensis]|uniref:Aminotransferase class V-fold PLP-dependent enzyme n=1 Tax=Streptomyces iconiensis TaxID=1384038 RepID=A0ABT7A708_9ACTN|nr:aminotransferase class V-fold PLP-dependent enzyme [Streptomyces iconiensis]MDJ1137101.1 aminotransferase class V-fold PLP-dependent enzyme [Streptomyces iconiensis]
MSPKSDGDPVSRPAEAVLADLRALRTGDAPTRGGRTFAYVYDSGLEGLDGLAAAAYAEFATVNALDMTVFPSVAALENDIVTAAARLLGTPETQGTFTSGGTESILLAVKTARDHARAERGVTAPELLVPSTAHAAFHKAAAWLGVRLVTVPADPGSHRADPEAMAAALTERTVLAVASAPSYAHGVLDPVAEIAAAAAARGVLCHVDACVGGWLLPHLRRAGHPVPEFGLTVPGVTSLSVDLHKYGYVDKGASVVLYRDAELRRHQYFACADWPGYPVVNPTAQGTKSAGLLAQSWAVLQHIGDDGYTALAVRVREALDAVLAGLAPLAASGEVRVLGEPSASLVALTVLDEGGEPDTGLVLHTADEMRERGWYLQPQLSHGDSPASLHLTLTPASAGRTGPLLADLRAALAAARRLPSPLPDPDTVAFAAALEPDTLTPEEAAAVLAAGGLGGGPHGAGPQGGPGLPARSAGVLAMLDALPVRLKERLLNEFVGTLFRTGAGPW